MWLGVIDRDTLVAYGEHVFVSGVYDSVMVSIQIGYWDNIQNGEYEYRLFECNDSTEVGNIKLRSSSAAAGWAVIEDYSEEEDHDCCTKVNDDDGRVFVSLLQMTT